MARPVILLLSGPNLNLLGERQPEIYGTATLLDHVQSARRAAAGAGFEVEHLQSNHEGDLVDAIQTARGRVAAIIINPGALTHYGWSIHDALAAFDEPIIELHLSEPRDREAWRHISVVEPVATARVAGLGGNGYPEAVRLAIEEAGGPVVPPGGRAAVTDR
ncbi:MAG: 3-dehydroquinate dehydratase [Actinomycetota bacterium]|nr:3-dehydroquinate dehydratase [Actinomycetota bacterium]